jgi:hypothetical protein
MRKYGISGKFAGVHSWSGMAGSTETGMHGNLYTTMRLMPMLRAGRYTAQIMLRDMTCSGMMAHTLAYQTPKTTLQLK